MTPKEGIACGAVTVEYNKSDESVWRSSFPTAVGTYAVRINVAGSDAYQVTDPSWTFTIAYGNVTESMYTIRNIKYDANGNAWARSDRNPIIYAADGYWISSANINYFKGFSYDESGDYTVYIKEDATGKVYCGAVALHFTLDNAVPVIQGIEDGQMFYNQEVTFTVEDGQSGIEKVTYQPQDSSEVFTITPEADGSYRLPNIGKWYTVRACDFAGNSSNVEVYVGTCEHEFFTSDTTHTWNTDENGRIVSCTASAECWNRCQQTITETTTQVTSRLKQRQSCTDRETRQRA